MSNLNLYQNGILRVYSPRKGRDWSFDWRRIQEFVGFSILIAAAIIILIKEGVI